MSPLAERPRLPISVIVPVYNAAATLPRAVDSVRAQTCLPFEIIVVDDASSDGSWDVIQRLVAEGPDPPIRTVRLATNGGPAAARNAGWAVADREFLAFLDADDAWHPCKLEVQYGWMVDNPQVALCGHRCVVASSAAPVRDLPVGMAPVRFYGVTSFLIANRLSTPSVMLRRKVRQRFAGGKSRSEDFLLWVRIVAEHGPAAFLDFPLAFLFKPRYGAAGLSGDLWRMYCGELDSYAQLRHERIISTAQWLAVVAWSWAKFVKRAIVHLLVPMERSALYDKF